MTHVRQKYSNSVREKTYGDVVEDCCESIDGSIVVWLVISILHCILYGLLLLFVFNVVSLMLFVFNVSGLILVLYKNQSARLFIIVTQSIIAAPWLIMTFVALFATVCNEGEMAIIFMTTLLSSILIEAFPVGSVIYFAKSERVRKTLCK